jgi:tripartite motif-containing protein 71
VRQARSWIWVALIGLVGVSAVGATAGRQAATAGPTFKVVGTWGKDGSANGQFRAAKGIAVDKAGNVYVADTDNDRVQVFTAKGAFLRKWGSQGDGNDQFLHAEDVNIAPNGTVWVADEGNERLQAFSATGSFDTSISTPREASRGIGVAADGSVLAAANGEERSGFRRWVEKPTGWEAAGGLMGAGEYRIDEIEGSPDGTIYVTTNKNEAPYDARVRRYTVEGKPLGSFKRSDNNVGIGIDLDCNIWSPDTPNRRIVKYSPSGKMLATAAVPDLVANDIAVGPTGDIYVLKQGPHGVVHFAENKAKPATAGVPAAIAVAKGVAKIKFALPGVSCPAQVAAVATLKGQRVSGKASVEVAAGKATVIEMKVNAPKGTTPATFKIVLKTNGRPTTQTKRVQVKA